MHIKNQKRLEIYYQSYLVLKEIYGSNKEEFSYKSRCLGQLVYNKFGKELVGFSESSIMANPNELTEDHFNNCQKVGEFLLQSPILTKQDFTNLIIESRKTIKVTKKENSALRKFQKTKPYGFGLEAYKEAGIEIVFS